MRERTEIGYLVILALCAGLSTGEGCKGDHKMTPEGTSWDEEGWTKTRPKAGKDERRSKVSGMTVSQLASPDLLRTQPRPT